MDILYPELLSLTVLILLFKWHIFWLWFFTSLLSLLNWLIFFNAFIPQSFILFPLITPSSQHVFFKIRTFLFKCDFFLQNYSLTQPTVKLREKRRHSPPKWFAFPYHNKDFACQSVEVRETNNEFAEMEGEIEDWRKAAVLLRVR